MTSNIFYPIDSQVVVHRPCALLVELLRLAEKPGGEAVEFGIRVTNTWQSFSDIENASEHEVVPIRSTCTMVCLNRGEIAQLAYALLDRVGLTPPKKED